MIQSTHSAIHRYTKQCDQKIAKTTGKNPCSKTRKSDVNKVSVEQEQEDNDTISYTSANNGKPLLTIIEKEFDLNKTIMKFLSIR